MPELALQLSDEQLASILADGKQQILDAVQKEIIEQLTWVARNEMVKELKPVISSFLQKEIVPELVDMLAGQKSTILAEVVKQANEIGTTFAKGLVAQLAGVLGNDYKRKKLFEDMFK